MPRHPKTGSDFDFVIHEDYQHPDPLDECRSVTDFAYTTSAAEKNEPSLGTGDDETLLNHDLADHIPVQATDSNMTKASTLVDEQPEQQQQQEHAEDAQPKTYGGKDVESAIASILEELQDGEDTSDDRTDTEVSNSRRESAVTGTQDGGTEGSFSRRESTMTTETYDRETEGSVSSRESTMSSGTYESSRRESGREYGSTVDYGTEDDEPSVLNDEGHTQASESRRESVLSAATDDPHRRASGRTEALIKAAARDIVDQINHGRESGSSQQAGSGAGDQSAVTNSRHTSARPSDIQESLVDESVAHSSARPSHAHESLVEEDVEHPSAPPSDTHESLADGSVVHNHSLRQSDAHDWPPTDERVVESVEHNDENLPPATEEGGADSSSHNENEDDVFSDHSPRSSVGSLPEAEQHRKMNPNVTQRRSQRISDFSHYDTDDQEDIFVPTVRGTPRPPFRSPSSVKAIQMSSPTPSVLGSSSRSSRRTPLPTVSRLGSPSAQYSPKKTPPRFKRNTPPLVLLHATLLPLRWPWGGVLDNCRAEDLSQGGKGLLEAWRLLQDVLGDTVCERGILLPHPQNDFEVLEERLLEALELPLRRRARILECGHYLGPSNEMSLREDVDSEDEYDQYDDSRESRGSSLQRKTHWCGTCQSEIKCDSLGMGKVFRVKVYASNGLVKAGAWEACWKEMERVDVELEPIVETDVLDELVRLDAEQQRTVEMHGGADDGNDDDDDGDINGGPTEHDVSYMEHEVSKTLQHHHPHMASSPPPEIRITSSPPPPLTDDDDRRRRDEERLREIYGHTPPAHPEPSAEKPPSSEYADHRTPPSPSAEAYARREERRHAHKNDSLPELLLEALRVMMQDRKNVTIAIMSALVLVLALRGGLNPSVSPPGVRDPATWQTVVQNYEATPATVTVTATATTAASAAREIVESVAPMVEEAAVMSSAAGHSQPEAEEVSSQSDATDPCSTGVGDEVSSARHEPETVVSERIVRIVETVTESAVETMTVTATPTQDTQQTEVALDEEPSESVEAVAWETKELSDGEPQASAETAEWDDEQPQASVEAAELGDEKPQTAVEVPEVVEADGIRDTYETEPEREL
ncbi:hypothetical protein ACRE_006940 [Hapsidospora chrysogenum ATCC 11550]|uniref:Pathway-specific nitrogen regulator n=1 Tax=Hapsidospora chrysogenum (strain ATCC 11550 / CBS 779.69 / DSM 880 / IAM 14645 / JCM 23072 / IMI 49137) TaxID=857340 RepID=A0A086TGP3_HAPC1|nr:hypothetical protein ACRE_006940 [Hapsidospora chrysogenum ATCC 11550]